MKKYFRVASFIIILVLSITLLIGCSEDKQTYHLYEGALVTSFESPNNLIFATLEKMSDEALSSLKQEINEELTRLDDVFNVQDRGNNKKTILMEINENAGIKAVSVTDEIIYVLKRAKEVAEETIVAGVKLYDISVSPVWKLWDFPNKNYNNIFPRTYEIPSVSEVNELLPLVNIDNLIVDEEEKTAFLTNLGMSIDLGSIVKGYAADRVKEILVNHGITKAIIDIGNNFLFLGSSYDSKKYEGDLPVDIPFGALIRTPLTASHPEFNQFSGLPEKYNTIGSLEIADKTLVTSGTYEKYIKGKDNKEYHHIIDPRTGFPFANGVVSISIITSESILGDAYSTAIFSLGLEKGMELVNSKDDLETIWVVKNDDVYEIYISSGLEGNFKYNSNLNNIGFIYKGVYEWEH